MTVEVKQVITCDGWVNGVHCGRVINDEPYLTLVMRAVRSDMPKTQYVGMERWHAEKKAGLRKEVHLHVSCTLPQDVVPALLQHAGTVTEWPELTEAD